MISSKKKKTSIPRSAAKPRQKRFGQTDKRVHRDLYAAIIDHSLSPGTALQEDALAQAFGVSRTVIRKVLQQLALERLVDIVPNRGAAVAKPTAEEARQVFEARRVVERILVERVIARAADADFAELITTARAEQVAFEAGNRQERVKLSGDFHRQLARLGGNKVLGDFLNELVSRTSLIIALYESPGAVPCSHSEHLEIADAMKRRDVAKALQYMEHHLLHIEAQTDLTDVHQKVDFRSLFGSPD
ncbi:MAG: GntR family transcriptional regulator [Parvibaculaceae bacterium]